MVDTSLSDKQKLLLMKGVKQGGTISMELAEQLYSTRNSAKSALSTLQFHGFISVKTMGVFKVEKVPRDVKDQLEQWRDQRVTDLKETLIEDLGVDKETVASCDGLSELRDLRDSVVENKRLDGFDEFT